MVKMLDRRVFVPATVLLAAAYFAAGKLGLLLAFVHASATAVWPPTGIALAACLILGYRAWPGILLGAFLVNLTTAGSVVSALGIAGGNTVEALVGAYLVNRFANGRRAFERPQDVFKFAALAAVASPAVSATLGVTSLALTGEARWADFGAIWATWWLGDAGGALIVAPLLVLWSTRPQSLWSRRQALEAGLLFLALVVTGLMVFDGLYPFDPKHYPLEFLAFPALVWAAFRFGPRETVTASLLLSGIAIWGTLFGVGPFARGTQNESLLLLEIFMGVATVMSMALAAAVLERQHAEEARRATKHMEGRLEGVTLAGREMAHLLNNALAMPVAAIDLLQQQATLPPHLCTMVAQAADSLALAAEHVRQLQQVEQVETKDTVVGPALDLARSVRLSPRHDPHQS
jgi:integral membrane sensor domain MASE1